MDIQHPPSLYTCHYRFGDRVIASALRLRELPAIGPNSTDAIRIEAGSPPNSHAPAPPWLHRWDAGVDEAETAMGLARVGNHYLLRFSRICDFELDFAQCLIRVNAHDGVDDNTVEHLLVDQVLPRFMAHQGELLVHASALTMGGRTALFLGESGWGKSTLAGLLHRAGHELLSDDCVQLKHHAGRYLALPTYPSLRLFADSLDHAFPQAQGLTAVSGYSDKRRLPVAVADAALEPAPVHALYLLDEPSEHIGQVAIGPMRPVSACMELMRHAFKLEVADLVATRRLFGSCSDAARALPAFSLDYPRDFDQSQTLVDTIIRHLAALPDAHSRIGTDPGAGRASS